MRIAFNGRFLTRPMTGVDRFAHELLNAWTAHHPAEQTARVLIPKSPRSQALPSFAIPLQVAGVGAGHLWEQLELPVALQQEFLVNLCNTGPMFMRHQLAVLHDAAVLSQPSVYTFPYRTWNRRMMAGLLKNARVTATVSEFSASEFMRHWGIRARGMEIISESGEHILREPAQRAILTRLNLTDQPYILAVGSRTANKNFRVVAQAARALDDLNIKLVAVGGGSSRVYAGMVSTDSNVVTAGYVTDAELRALYENARCFVFPSLYEGFGLPPLEAMHCGCPVIVSRRASLPEVCAGAAVYCDPLDCADVAAQIRRLLTSRALREELQAAGLARAATFSWRLAADKLAALLGDVAAGGR